MMTYLAFDGLNGTKFNNLNNKFKKYNLIMINPFHVTGLFLFSLKTENIWFSDALRGVQIETSDIK